MTTTAEPGTDLAVYEDAPPPALRAPVLPGLPDTDTWIRAMASIAKLADQICNTDFVPKAMRGNPAAVTAAILTGREFGWGPMLALRSIHIINGTPGLYAKVKRAMILAAGHEFRITAWDDDKCTAAARRKGDRGEPLIMSYTMADARRAGLEKRNENYRTNPKAMLLARVTTLIDSALFSDVTNGLATADLLDDADALADAIGSSLELPALPPPPVEELRQRAAAHTVASTVITPEPSPAAAGISPPPAERPRPADASPGQAAGESKTAAEFVAERLAALGAENPANAAARILGRPPVAIGDLSDPDAVTVMRFIRNCQTPLDLDGLLAELEMANDPRGGTGE